MSAHTRAPWKRDPQVEWNIVDERGAIIACVFPGDPEIDLDECEANACLIETAPALLAALVTFGEHSHGCSAYIRWQQTFHDPAGAAAPPTVDDVRCDCGLRAAIALARGEGVPQ